MWITSNIDPANWYPDGKPAQISALMRRLNIIKLDKPYLNTDLQKEKYMRESSNWDLPTDNAKFWKNAPSHEGIPIGDIMDVPEWRDYLGNLLSEPELPPEDRGLTAQEELEIMRESGKTWEELFLN